MLAHVPVFEVHAAAAEMSGVVLEEQSESGRLLADEREHDFGGGIFAEKILRDRCIVGRAGVRELLVLRELLYEPGDERNVGARSRAEPRRFAHGAAISLPTDPLCEPT